MNEKIADSEKKEARNRLNLILKVILLSIVIFFLFIAYFMMLEWGSPFYIAILVDLFLLLFFSGLIFKSRKKSLISRIFPIKDKPISFSIKSEDDIDEKEDPINIDFNYRRSLIKKCNKCGMILTNRTKRCPNCQTVIKRF